MFTATREKTFDIILVSEVTEMKKITLRIAERRKLCLKYYVLPEHCLVNPIIEIINY